MDVLETLKAMQICQVNDDDDSCDKCPYEVRTYPICLSDMFDDYNALIARIQSGETVVLDSPQKKRLWRCDLDIVCDREDKCLIEQGQGDCLPFTAYFPHSEPTKEVADA